MQRLFYRDVKTEEQISYEQLLKDIYSTEYFIPYLKCESYYEIFKQIIISLLIGRELVLLDSDFKEDELEKLIGASKVLAERIPFSASEVLTIDNLVEKMSKHLTDWRITLFTSGTTGLPKKVSHTYESIARQVRMGKTHADDVWGYAYNPTHMAGLQVFFQCLLNLNSIVRLFGLKKEEIYTEIQDYGITHISATPTFYRLLLPASEMCGSVVRMTSGGEKFDKQTLDALHSAFPNAQLTNVYASTEAGTLFASKGNNFMIKGDMMSKVKFETGAIGTLHTHPHTQATYVASGVFEFTTEGETKVVRPGDGVYMKPGVLHGCKCLEAGVLIDTFSPMRKDFIK